MSRSHAATFVHEDRKLLIRRRHSRSPPPTGFTEEEKKWSTSTRNRSRSPRRRTQHGKKSTSPLRDRPKQQNDRSKTPPRERGTTTFGTTRRSRSHSPSVRVKMAAPVPVSCPVPITYLVRDDWLNSQKQKRYRVIKLLGRGAYAAVYLCEDYKYQGKRIALKVFHTDSRLDDDWAESEAAVLEFIRSKLRHQRSFVQYENVRSVQHSVTGHRWKSICYEALGPSVHDFMQFHQARHAVRGFPLETIRLILYQVTLALAVLHSLDIIHRDIKVDNVLFIDPLALVKIDKIGDQIAPHNQEVRLVDFGSALLQGSSEFKSTKPNLVNMTVPETPQYRSPESLLGTYRVGAPSDIWALGCMAAELYTGNVLFDVFNDQAYEHVQLIENLLRTELHCPTEFLKRGSQSVHRRPNKLPPFEDLIMDVDLRRFIVDCFHYHPYKRMTALQALDHPFLAGVASSPLGIQVLRPVQRFLHM